MVHDPPTAPAPRTHHLYLRMPPDLVAALDEWVEDLRAERPGFRGITRTDLIRDLLYRAVEERRVTKGGK